MSNFIEVSKKEFEDFISGRGLIQSHYGQTTPEQTHFSDVSDGEIWPGCVRAFIVDSRKEYYENPQFFISSDV